MVVGRFAKQTTLPIGLEFSRDAVRAVQLRRRRAGWQLVAAVETPISFEEETIDEATAARLVASVTGLFGLARFHGRQAVIGLHDNIVRARTVRQPPLTDAERSKAIALDGASRLDFTAGDAVVVDYLKAGEIRHGADHREELIYVGGLSAGLQVLIDSLRHAGVGCVAVEPAFIAGCRGAAMSGGHAEPAPLEAVVDVGRSRTSVTLARGADVAFHKSFDLGTTAMTEAAAGRLGVEPQVAEEIRWQRVRTVWNARADEAGDPKLDRAIFEAVRPIMSHIGQEISLCLRHHGTTFRGARAERCVLIGRGALEPRLCELVQDATGTPTFVADPLQELDCAKATGSLERRIPNPQLATALGLSLRAASRRGGKPRAQTPFGPQQAPGTGRAVA